MDMLKKIPVTMTLIALNVLIFIVTEFSGGTDDLGFMLRAGAAYTPWILQDGQWYRLITAMFLHFGSAHLMNNMLVLFVLGLRMEPLLGKFRMLVVYLVGGLGGNLVSMLLERQQDTYAVSAGASGAVFALMGAMLFALIQGRGHVQDLNTRQVLVMAAFSVYLGFATEGTDNAAHLGGRLCGFILTALTDLPGSSHRTRFRPD